MRATFIMLLTVLMLVASSFVLPAVASEVADVSASGTAVSTEPKTAAEECRDSCTRDYELCGEEGQASDQSMNGRPSAGFSKNHCNASLSACMMRCRGL